MVAIAALQAASTEGNSAMAGRNRLGNAGELERELGDHAERAFRPDEQPREIVARRGFPRTARGVDHLAVREDRFEREHVVLHGAVAHGIGAGATRRRHAAERSVGAGIDRKEQALIAQMLVELLARDAGSITQSRSSAFTASTLFMSRKSIDTPPRAR